MKNGIVPALVPADASDREETGEVKMNSIRTTLAALLIGALAFNLPGTGALTNVLETWENGTSGWTITGSSASQDCTVAHTGSCSLKIYPSVSNTAVTVQKSFSLSLTGTGVYVGTRFLCDSTTGDTDFNFVLLFNDGTSVLAHLTNGVGTNNDVSFVGTDGVHHATATWSSANTWYEVRIGLNSVADVGWVDLYDGSGVLITSGALNTGPISSTATSITAIRFEGVPWNSPQNTCWFDQLTSIT
jgi:hypothetical protein